MVGRKHPDDRIGIAALQQKRRQPNRWRGIAPDRLGQHLVRIEPGKLLHDRVAQVLVGDDPEPLARRQRLEPLDRLLDHALRAVERQQLLGPALAAERPEARAAAAREYDGIKIAVR